MTRPTIVIGLGGTGQWILTFLKKELLEIGEGKIPPGVKLLCFDTTNKAVAKVGAADDTNRQTETEIKLGSVKLEQDIEFIPIGDNVYDLAKEIRDGQNDPERQKHPHIASWFDAKEMLNRHQTMTFNLAEGAGRLRAFGRMAIFKDLAKGTKGKMRSHILSAIRTLKAEVDVHRQLEIIIIASFAGGTGAGMFVDTGILARHEAAALVEKNLCVRGFYILPRVFASQDVDMNARAFAAWRELDRFLMIGQKFGQRNMDYSASDTGLNVKLDDRIFDVCYLVDAIGDGKNSLENTLPENGLFPMVSDVISTIMDSKAGLEYTQYITSNLAGKLDTLPRAPYHSAIGAYTIKVPVYYDLQVYAHKFGLDILQKLTEPIKDTATKQIRSVAYDKNEEKPNSYGKDGALEFLRARSSADFGLVKDEKVNTTFTHLVAEIAESEKRNDQAFILRVAMMNLDVNQRAAETGKYLGALVNISDDEKGKKIKADVESELNLPLYREVPPSRMVKDNPNPAFERIKIAIPKFMTDHYGHKLADGTDRPGKYGAALKICQSYQVERYRDMLYLWLGATLNGTVDDVERAKGGKIGYVQGVLSETVKVFSDFIEYFGKVRKERTDKLVKLNLDQMTNNALEQYRRHKADWCWLTVNDSNIHPRAHMKQIAYLKAEQVKIDHRKYDILLNLLVETADTMKFITESVLTQVNNWVEYLVLGNPERQITGLYKRVEGSLDLTETNHAMDVQLERVQRIIGEQPYTPDKTKLLSILDRVNWQVTTENSQIKLGLTIGTVTGQGVSSIRFLNSGENATENNLRSILSLGEGVYANMPQMVPVAKLLMDTYANANDLADALNLRAEPLYEKSETLSDPKAVSCYVRVDTTNIAEGKEAASKYMQDVIDRINVLHPLAVAETNYKILPSDNKFRMTVMRSDDLLLSEGFNLYNTCKAAYEKVMRNTAIPAEHLQIFPAERNAAFYEKKIYDLLRQGNYRILHPSVVALLEDKLAIEYFFQAIAFDFIRKERVNQQDLYFLDLPGAKQQIHLNKISNIPGKYLKTDLLEVIDVFVNKRSSVDNDQYYIDMSKVGMTIQNRINEIGTDGAVERMQFQIDKSDGIVSVFRLIAESRREDVQPNEKPNVAVEYDDLADLAKVIYKEIISTIQS